MIRRWQNFAALAAAVLAAVAATAQDGKAPGRTISVTGAGKVKIVPDTVEIRGELQGAAPIAADAMKKYQQHRQRLVDSLKALKIENLETEFGGTSIISSSQVNQMFAGPQPAETPAASNLTVSEPVTIRLANVASTPAAKLFEHVLKIVDVANDNGLQLSEPANRMMAMQFGEGLEATLATFLVRDETKVRQLAFKAAMADARQRGGDFAALAGAELGQIQRIKESSLSTSGASDSPQSLMMRIYGLEEPKPKSRFSSPNFGEIEIIAKLEVEFSLAP